MNSMNVLNFQKMKDDLKQMFDIEKVTHIENATSIPEQNFVH